MACSLHLHYHYWPPSTASHLRSSSTYDVSVVFECFAFDNTPCSTLPFIYCVPALAREKQGFQIHSQLQAVLEIVMGVREL